MEAVVKIISLPLPVLALSVVLFVIISWLVGLAKRWRFGMFLFAVYKSTHEFVVCFIYGWSRYVFCPPAPTMESKWRLDESLAVVIGGTSGQGLQVAKTLARVGATVIITSRSSDKAILARKQVEAETGNPHVELMVLDLNNHDSIKSFAKALISRKQPVDLLVCNAGIVKFFGSSLCYWTGVHDLVQSNYLGYFLLLNLLLPKLQLWCTRVVITSSPVQNALPCLPSDIFDYSKRRFTYMYYIYSKMALSCLGMELSRRLWGCDVILADPGFFSSHIGVNGGMRLLGHLYEKIAPPPQAFGSVMLASLSPRLQGSGFTFVSWDLRHTPGSASGICSAALNSEFCSKLWQQSSHLCNSRRDVLQI